MSDHSQLKQMLIENEGSIEHMYLDTVGKVTVGVGHMIPGELEAQRINFVVRGTMRPATTLQISSEFGTVGRQRPAMTAASYRQFTTLDMTPDAIDSLLDSDIAIMEAGVRANFFNYDSYPAPAKDALLDMAFNLGVHGLVAHFPHLKAGADSQNWRICAAQCRRNGISDTRNQKTMDLFLAAARLAGQ
jgi:GH24 family phage-related lysozyme (muramidase)